MIDSANHGFPRTVRTCLTFGCSMLIGLIIFLQTSTNVSAVVASAIDGPTTDSTASSHSQFTTHQLIEQAAAAGRITPDQRLVYLAYAVYEPESLPDEFRGNGGWSGTQVVREIGNAKRSAEAALASASIRELDRVLNPSMTGAYCDQMDGALVDESIFFAFTYSTEGANPIVGATIQQYKDALDKAYSTIVDSYGWARPPLCLADNVFDDAFENECQAVNPFGKIPVQITDAGAGTYGYVVGEGGNYAGIIGDNPNTAAEELLSTASCVVMDNDFLELAAGDGDEAIRQIFATSAHEFFHAVQNAYGDPGNAQLGAMWAESTAAYFEDEVDDEANTQYQYLWPVMTQPLENWPTGGDPGETSEYSNFLFFRHIAENHGGANNAGPTAGHTVMRTYFELVAQDENDRDVKMMHDALSMATPPTSLAQAHHDFAIATRFSKPCVAGYTNPLCFEEGAQYVASNADTPGVQETIGPGGGSRTGSVEDGFAVYYAALPTDGQSYDFTLINNSSNPNIALQASLVCDSGSSLNAAPVGVANAGATVSANSFSTNCVEATLVVTSADASLLTAQARAKTLTNFSFSLTPAEASGGVAIYLPLISR